jgi:uncharacterized protein (DUF1697 family)
MTRYVALLRGINVGGHRPVAMADLRRMLSHLGFTDGQSVLQSGNLVFRTDGATGAALERRLEAEAVRRLRLQTDFFVRTAREWRAVIAGNPFADAAEHDPGHLVVQFLKRAPRAGAVEALREAIHGPEVVHAAGRHLYIVYPAGIGRSRLTAALMDGKLGTRGTGRNWNTVLRLSAMLEG